MEVSGRSYCGFDGCVPVEKEVGLCKPGLFPKISLLKKVMRSFSGMFCCFCSSQKNEDQMFTCVQVNHVEYRERLNHSIVDRGEEHLYMVLPIVHSMRPDGSSRVLLLSMRPFDDNYRRERESLIRSVRVWTV